MNEIKYFPIKEKHERWPLRINNTLYKVFSYSPETGKIKTRARGLSPEKAGEELFKNIREGTFPKGEISRDLLSNEENIRKTTYKEHCGKKGIDDSIVSPLNEKEFENLMKTKDNYNFFRE